MHATGSSDIVNIITFDDRSDSRHVFQELHYGKGKNSKYKNS